MGRLIVVSLFLMAPRIFCAAYSYTLHLKIRSHFVLRTQKFTNDADEIESRAIHSQNSEKLTVPVTEDEYTALVDIVRDSSPDGWTIIKELLGINAFTYMLAGLIIFFLSMNFIYGEGWLGQTIGLEGTGSFEQVSENLPLSIDLSDSKYTLF
jgi:hypothetical protein